MVLVPPGKLVAGCNMVIETIWIKTTDPLMRPQTSVMEPQIIVRPISHDEIYLKTHSLEMNITWGTMEMCEFAVVFISF